MTKYLLAGLALLCALLTGLTAWTWQRLSDSRDEAARLRSSVQALEESAVRSSRAMAAYRLRQAASESTRVALAQALERALAASPDWAATPVPPEVQDAR